MRKIDSFELAKMVLDGVTEDIGDKFVIDDTLMSELMTKCALLDRLCDAHDGVMYECDVDIDTKDVILTVHCVSFVALSADDIFYKLSRMSKKLIVRPSHEDEDAVALDFVVKGVWKEKE